MQEHNTKYWKIALSVILFGQVFTFLGISTTVPTLPFIIQNDLGVKSLSSIKIWNGLLTGGQGITLMIFLPIWGALSDRFGKKVMLLRVNFAGGIILCLMALAKNPWELLILRLLQGCFTGSSGAAAVFISSIVPRGSLGSALGLLEVSNLVGNSLGPAFGGFIFDHFGGDVNFIVSGCFFFLSGLLVLFFTKETPILIKETKKIKFFPDFKLIKESKILSRLLIIIFFGQVAFVLVTSIIALFVQEISSGSSASHVGTLSGAIIAFSSLSAALGAMFFSRIGKYVSYQSICMLCLIGGAISYIPQAFSNTWEFLTVFRLIGSFLIGGLMPCVNALIAFNSPPEKQGGIFGLAASLGAGAIAFGPALGALISIEISYRGTFLFSSLILLVLIFLFRHKFENIKDSKPMRVKKKVLLP